MSLAKYRKVGHKTGSGRFVVSEGVASSEILYPHEGLPTWYEDDEDDRFEIVIPKGAILSVVKNSDGDSRVVPANGSTSAFVWNDTISGFDPMEGATPASSDTGSGDEVSVPARSVPIGCAQYDLYRMFDKGASQLTGFISYGYVEWPMIEGVNADVNPGDVIVSDFMGRPVKGEAQGGNNTEISNYPHLVVGKCLAIETFATNFDDGLLSYMQLPSDPGALKEVYELTHTGPYAGKLGIRVNLDRDHVVGAFRVRLTL